MTVPTAEGPILIYPPTATTVAIEGSDKFVFRVPGTGPIQLSATGPEGRDITPTELSYHGLDSSQQVGEWGSLWDFPVIGCWDMRVTRDSVSGDVLMSVTRPRISGVTLSMQQGGVTRREIHPGRAVLVASLSLVYADPFGTPQARVVIREGSQVYWHAGWRTATGGTEDNPIVRIPFRIAPRGAHSLIATVTIRLERQRVKRQADIRVTR
jgi:hypothetical protein